MNQLLEWLSDGDLRSDGLSSEVAVFVLDNPQVFDDLIEGLHDHDDVVRGHTADAMEKVSRKRPDLLEPHIVELIQLARTDGVMVVKMHLAMIFGNMAIYEAWVDELMDALLLLLEDEYVFVRSWSISSLCIIARKYSAKNQAITERIVPLQNSDSAAIRSRVRNALRILTDPDKPFPKGWIKSEKLHGI